MSASWISSPIHRCSPARALEHGWAEVAVMPVIEVEMGVPRGRLVWFRDVDKSISPMEVHIAGHGNYRVFEAYCTDPRCECETAHLLLSRLDGEESFSFDLNLKDLTLDSRPPPRDEKYLAAIEETIKNLSSFQKATLISHYRRAKEFGREDPTSYLDFSHFEFGRYLAYEGVFGRGREEVFSFIHGGKRYHVVDSYCLDPSCDCETVVLCVYEVESSGESQDHAFLFQVKLDQSAVGMKEQEEAEKFFNERIRGNVELFAVLLERYHKMKELGKKILRRHRKKEKSHVKFTPSGAHVPRIGEELVEKMISCGLMVNHGLVKELLERREVVPSLINIIEDDRYWEPEGLGGGWGPIHAIHLLGAIKTNECLRALVKLIRSRKALGDWLTEEMPSILAGFGPRAVGPLKELVENRGLDIFSRAAAVRALAAIAHQHEEIRGPVVELLRKVMMGEGEDPEFRGLVADDLAQFKDSDALADLKSLFDRGMIDETIIDWKGVERIYETPEEKLGYRRDMKNPLDYFLPGNLRRLWEINYGGGPAHFIDATGRVIHQDKPKKVERNDPCPCGSGRKYKNCCWLREKHLI